MPARARRMNARRRIHHLLEAVLWQSIAVGPECLALSQGLPMRRERRLLLLVEPSLPCDVRYLG
jgi:hypothetical protein